jgi:DNA-binding NarL/FixJ family response regulator
MPKQAPIEDPLARGKSALARADWADARAHFEGAADPESGEALDGLSEALWWLGEWSRSRELREKAFAQHRGAGQTIRAARAAMWLGNEYIVSQGNRAAWNGWLERAATLLDAAPPCAEHGWLLFMRGRRAAPDEMERACTDALAIARRHGDVDLEVLALSQLGHALVALGHVEEGFSRLDESMAAVTTGEPRSFFTVCDTCCNMLTTCEGAAEIARLTQWCRVTDEISRRLNGVTIYAFCRLSYASALFALGRWGEVEKQLRAALESCVVSYPFYSVHMIAKLAELRLAQGRIAEAEELLAGHEESAFGARAVAQLRILQDQPRAAAKLLERRLAQLRGDLIQTAPLLVLLVEAHLACEDVASARRAASDLAAIAEKTSCSPFVASADLAAGTVTLAEGDAAAAWVKLDAARARYLELEMPYEAARARLETARALAVDDRDAAREIARGARADFERLGAARHVDRAAELLRQLGVGGGPGKRVELGTLSNRESEVLSLLGLGLSNPEIGKRLFISPKTVEHHVSKILAKLGLKGRTAAAAYVIKQGQK